MKWIVLLKGRERETGGETPYSLDDYIFSLEARSGMPDPYSGQYRTVPSEMEFLNGILVEVSGHKLEPSQTKVFVWLSTLIFSFYKMLFMN
jgi:hypothetical protein